MKRDTEGMSIGGVAKSPTFHVQTFERKKKLAQDITDDWIDNYTFSGIPCIYCSRNSLCKTEPGEKDCWETPNIQKAREKLLQGVMSALLCVQI